MVIKSVLVIKDNDHVQRARNCFVHCVLYNCFSHECNLICKDVGSM